MPKQAFPDRILRTTARGRLLGRFVLQAVTLVTACLFFTASLSAQASTDEQTPEDRYLGILKLMKSASYERALSESRKIIEQAPQFVPAYGKFVEASDALGLLNQAGSYFEDLLKGTLPNVYAYYGLAAVQRRLKNPLGAIETARQCQQALPNFTPCYVILVDTYLNNLKKPEEAEAYLKSLVMDNPDISAAHYALGYLYYLRGNWAAGLSALEKSISLDSSMTDAKQIKALIYYYNSRYIEALEINQSLLELAKAGKDIDRQLRAQVNIGILYRLLGDYSQAISQLKESLQTAEEIGERVVQGTCLSNLGAVCLQQDDYSQALTYVHRGLMVAKSSKDRRSEGRYLGNLGEIYHVLGNPAQAVIFSEQGLEIAKELGDKNNEASIRTDLGRFYTEQRRYDEAQTHFEEAVRITRDNNNRTLQRDALAGQAVLQYLKGAYLEALAAQQGALQLAQEISSPSREGDSQNSLGVLYIRMSNPAEALQSFQKALAIGERIKTPHIIWQAYAGLAVCHEQKRQFEEARVYYQRAAEVMESVRARLGGEDEKIGFFQNKTEIYKKLVAASLYSSAGRTEQERASLAFGFAERARARAFLDLLAEGNIYVEQDLAPDLLEQRQRIDALISRLSSELMKERSMEPARQNKAAIERLEKERGQADNDYANWLRELRRRDPRYAALKYPEPVPLAETQRLLDERTVMLSYSLGETSSYLFAVSRDGFVPKPLDGTAREIGQEVKRLIAAMTNRNTRSPGEFRRLSVRLYERLIQPAGDLLKGKSELIVVADGALHRLPFEVLLPPSSRRITQMDWRKLPYLVRDYAISYAPSASVLSGLQDYHRAATTGQKEFLAFADPLYEAEAQGTGSAIAMATRSAQGDNGQWQFKRLAHSKDEADGIAKLFPKDQADVFLGAQATEENAKRPGLLGQYRIIHFAAHGLINQSRPRFSGIVLSQRRGNSSEQKTIAEDGILQAYEVFNLKLNADLVVLSACETGLGKEVNGEGLMGLTRAFIYAGTPSVVVSLWNVDDEKSADLMIRFYFYLNAGKSKSEALRQGQLDLIERSGSPYFWAPFVLIGRAN